MVGVLILIAMKKELREVYECEFCGVKMLSEEDMVTHELLCFKNPINQPCSECENQVLGFGCSAGMNMDVMGGKVVCFRYKKGKPKSMLDMIDGNGGDL